MTNRLTGYSHWTWYLLAGALLQPPLVKAQAGAVSAIPDPARAGREIAERLRKSGPEKSISFDGWITITRAGRTNQYPIRSRIEVTTTNWLVHYIAGTNPPVDSLTIVHTPGRDNQYQDLNGKPLASSTIPNAPDLFQPFAGSDFWRIDLGLDFLAWPTQRQTAHQMRRGRACRVLESINPAAAAGTYHRVVSWVDVETDGILKAEAYDTGNRLVKEFLVGRFRKVDGQYQLEEMTIRRPGSREETQIRFNLGP